MMVTVFAALNPPSSDGHRLKSTPQIRTTVFTDPRNMISALGIELESRAKESNIVYSHAYELACQLRSGGAIAPDQFWIACHSRQGQVTSLEMVLSCTEGALGPYPIFIYSHRPILQGEGSTHPLSHQGACISMLATTLHSLVPPTRVFSIFSLTPITKTFAAEWTTLTRNKYPIVPSPRYAAKSSYCTVETFRGARASQGREQEAGGNSHHVMRKAAMEDLDQCAELCEVFAKTGPPYELSVPQARKEADGMIRAAQLWVYQLPRDDRGVPSSTESRRMARSSETAIATIVAVTRSTPSVSAITKVYTNVMYRNHGYAERLVAHVTNELLRKPLPDIGACPQVEAYAQQMKKQRSVVLFVGHTLDATRVYRRVGFVGLGDDEVDNSREHEPGDGKAEGVEDWLELGFEGANLGHW